MMPSIATLAFGDVRDDLQVRLFQRLAIEALQDGALSARLRPTIGATWPLSAVRCAFLPRGFFAAVAVPAPRLATDFGRFSPLKKPITESSSTSLALMARAGLRFKALRNDFAAPVLVILHELADTEELENFRLVGLASS